MTNKPRIFIFGNSHVSAFVGIDCIVPDNELITVELPKFMYSVNRLGSCTSYNFFWNPNYYQKVISILEDYDIKNEIFCLFLFSINLLSNITIHSLLFLIKKQFWFCKSKGNASLANCITI